MNSEADNATEDDFRKAIAAYMGQVRLVDDAVGRILDGLAESGRDSDTLVVFLSDHGELLGDQGVFHKIGVFYECLTRVPVIIRHPDGAYRGVFSGLVEEVGLAPTILDACGLSRPPSFVGESLRERLTEGRLGSDQGRETVLVETGLQAPTWPGPFREEQKAPFAPNNFGPGAMITDGRYKLSAYHDDACELYDLSADPHELDSRFDDPELAAVRERLTLDLCRRLLSVGVRDIGQIAWPGPGPDPRDSPLESGG